MGSPPRPDHRRPGQRDLRTKRRRSPQRLVHDRHQHRGLEILARQGRHARARDRSPPVSHSRSRNHPQLGIGSRLLQNSRRRRHLPRRTRAHPRPPVRRLQLARLVQRRLRPHRAQFRRPQLALESPDPASRVRHHRLQQAAMLGMLHQLSKRFARLHPHVWRKPKACSSSGDQAQEPISPRCALPPKV